ncbi:MAG: hypothetical protein JJ992_18845, partial [Planctomycetes bacterium]|nr:hypothetical protein [Planctomycetota bacterium]
MTILGFTECPAQVTSLGVSARKARRPEPLGFLGRLLTGKPIPAPLAANFRFWPLCEVRNYVEFRTAVIASR